LDDTDKRRRPTEVNRPSSGGSHIARGCNLTIEQHVQNILHNYGHESRADAHPNPEEYYGWDDEDVDYGGYPTMDPTQPRDPAT